MAILTNKIWTWFNNQVALRMPASMDLGGGDSVVIGGVGSTGITGLYRYYLDTGIILNYELNLLEQDDHDNPGIFLTDDGYICLAESQHNGNSYSRVPLAAKTPLVGARSSSALGADDAYAQLVQVGDTAKTLIWFYRNGGATNPRPQGYRTSTNRGSTWSADQDMFNVASNRPYFQYVRDDLDNKTIHCFCTDGQPNEATTSIYYFKIVVANDGTMTRWKSTGTQITASLPITTTDVELIWDASGGENGWVWDAKVYNGVPYIYFATFQSSDTVHIYRRGIINNGTVTLTQIATGGDVANHYLNLAESTYSGGICGDPNNADQCFVSRKKGSGNWQMYRHTFSAGSWSSVENISGDTGSINARPRVVQNCSTTETLITYWRCSSYASYTSYTGGAVLWSSTRGEFSLNSYTSSPGKPSVAIWQSAYAPPGVKLYLPLTEGTGTPSDYSSTHTPSTTGSPTWGSDAYGPYLTSFSTSNYIALGNVQTISYATTPILMLVVFRNSSTSEQWLISQGRSTDTIPLFGLVLNFGGTAGTVGGFIRNNANGSNNITIASTTCNDGNVHTLALLVGPTSRHLWFDSSQSQGTLTSLGTATFDRFTLGVLRRGTISNPCAGNIYGAYVCTGDMQDLGSLQHDIMRGQYSAIRSLSPTYRRLRRSRNSALLRM